MVAVDFDSRNRWGCLRSPLWTANNEAGDYHHSAHHIEAPSPAALDPRRTSLKEDQLKLMSVFASIASYSTIRPARHRSSNSGDG